MRSNKEKFVLMEGNVMFIGWAKYTRFTWWQFSSDFIDKRHLQYAYACEHWIQCNYRIK